VPIAQSSAIPKTSETACAVSSDRAYGWCAPNPVCFACLRLLTDLSTMSEAYISWFWRRLAIRLSKPFACRLRLPRDVQNGPRHSGLIEDHIIREDAGPQLMELMAVLVRPNSVFVDVARHRFTRYTLPHAIQKLGANSFEPHRKFSASLPEHAAKRTQEHNPTSLRTRWTHREASFTCRIRAPIYRGSPVRCRSLT